MKKILHLKIVLDKNSPNYLNLETVGKFLDIIQQKLEHDDWLVIASPFDMSISENGEYFYNFEMSEISKKELFELIK